MIVTPNASSPSRSVVNYDIISSYRPSESGEWIQAISHYPILHFVHITFHIYIYIYDCNTTCIIT